MQKRKARGINRRAFYLMGTLMLTGVALAVEQPKIEPQVELTVGEWRSKMATLIVGAQALYDRAAVIVWMNPKTNNDIDRIHSTLGDQWFEDEEAFTRSLRALPRNADIPDDLVYARVGLEKFGIIWNAVHESYSCKNTVSKWTLDIAHQFLDHAKVASEGHPDPNWIPDLDSAPTDHGMCRSMPSDP
jgi:hypothetical protein